MEKAKFWFGFFFPLLQHLLLSFFFFSFFLFQFQFDYLYEFVYGFDEFGSRFRTILMFLWCVRVVVVVIGGTGLQWWWLAVLGYCDGQFLLLLLLLGIEEWVRESLTRQERGERKKYKIIDRRATVVVHICMVTVAIVHKCTILHPLMWVFFFCSKYVKWVNFFYFAKFCIN